MKCCHLFNGIGGFALAAHWMGWENVMHCEIDSFCNRVMNYHFPKSVQHEDIKTTDFTIWRGKIDLLTGGFPCQPYSSAGKRLGKEDERHLWPEMLRAIREISPRWVVGENVRGLVNWNGGMVFDEVQSDLETEGYEVTPFLLPAAGVGAPHRRDRIWFIAHSKSNDATGESRCNNKGWQNSEGFGTRLRDESGGDVPKRTITNAARFDQRKQTNKANAITDCGQTRIESCGGSERIDQWADFPTQSPVCGRTNGISGWMVRYIKPEIYASISKRVTNEDLQEVQKAFRSKKVRQQVGGLYKIHETDLLLQTVQLCSPSYKYEERLSVFSEEASEELLRKMQQYGTLTDSPRGRELEKQFTDKFGNTLPLLSHEIALVTMEVERAATAYRSKWREESLKALGNAIVPQVALQIFEAIEAYETMRIIEKKTQVA